MRSLVRLALLASLAVLLLPRNVPAGSGNMSQKLPDFDLKTLEGDRLMSRDLRGKVLLLDFWGTWCPPCVSAVPSLRDLSHDMKGEPFVLVSIAVEEDDGPVRKFVQKNQMDWPQVWDRNASFARQSGISRFPTYVLVGHDGTVLSTVVGTSRGVEKSLRAQVEMAVEAARKAGPAGEMTR
ncbi:MAG: TlpA disulfide reductase family protein [Acidobacteriota bacterium]